MVLNLERRPTPEKTERRKGRRKRGRQTSRVKETLTGCLWQAPQLGAVPPAHTCALIGNRTDHSFIFSHMWNFTRGGPYQHLTSILVCNHFEFPLRRTPLQNLYVLVTILIKFLSSMTFSMHLLPDFHYQMEVYGCKIKEEVKAT
ncbi:hypothetical protein HJG60_010516 [Phyllostomus discolor]|uniref:Uncharacterized protein n=1 Tax=Phyllostomus discolor TaxID=89673 RepID=A0A834APG1_9CHIR|nr:hypothetical protein HJG60_010516 [Phyllostomus discolor]